METPQTSYDEIPYDCSVFSYTHPSCLATWATLLGMAPPPVDRCRLLELGCGNGANLIPMAHDLPGSRFVGVDLSPRQIAMGQEIVDALRLPNIDLRAFSITDIDESFGQFDYIVCHGVYSWVPAAVQDKILSICKRNLAPNGVAYVSYNTYPGWHIRGMIREMMGFHVRQFADPKERVQQAKALLEFLLQAVGKAPTLYGGLLQVEADMLKEGGDTYLFHEHLEEENHPVYFYQFAERAADKGLQYLCEARPSLLASNLSPEVAKTLERVSVDLIHGEQYLDFVRNRTFRWTLLCHQDAPVKRPPSPEKVQAMYVTGLVKARNERPDLSPDVAEEFATPDDVRLSSKNPLLKAAFLTLFEVCPRSLPFEELWRRVRARLADAPATAAAADGKGRTQLADILLQSCLSNFVELHVRPPEFVLEPSDRPVASPLARFQAANGVDRVINRRHHAVELGDFDRLVLRHLDGTRDRAALLDVLVNLVAQDVFSIEQGAQPVTDLSQARRLLAEGLEPCLRRLARSAVLVV